MKNTDPRLKEESVFRLRGYPFKGQLKGFNRVLRQLRKHTTNLKPVLDLVADDFFATNKEVVKNILKDLQDQTESEWIAIKDIKKNDSIDEKDLPIFIPVFKDGVLNNRPFWIGKKEKIAISDYIDNTSPKTLLLKNGVKVRTINKLKSSKYWKTSLLL